MPYTRWDPKTKARHIFKDDETAPANFLPCHPDDPDLEAKTKGAKPVAAPVAKGPEDLSGGMTKDEIIVALQQGGVEHTASENKAELCAKLIKALKETLTGNETEFAENATAKELLGLVMSSAG